MKHIEHIDNRDNLKAFHFLTAVTRDVKGRIKDATKVTIHGFTVKEAIKRFNAMTSGAEFILVKH